MYNIEYTELMLPFASDRKENYLTKGFQEIFKLRFNHFFSVSIDIFRYAKNVKYVNNAILPMLTR